MKVVVFVTYWSSDIDSADLNSHMLGQPLDYLKSVSGVDSVEIYTPEPGDVPKIDDIPIPTIITQIDLDSEENATTMVAADEFKQLFLDKDGFSGSIDKLNLELFEPRHYPVGSNTEPEPRTAPLTFVVRYYGPVQDVKKFVNFYTENHPPILAKFPNIRNVLCYLPLGWETAGELTDETILIGNEVVFDDLESFKAALDTDVLHEAMADADQFDPYGYSSHHAMHREMVYQK